MRPALFVGLGLGLHALLSLAFVWTVGRSHDVLNMDARWLMGPRPVEAMIAGDSHARYAVEAPILGSAINVAVPGEHYQKTTFRVPWLLDHGTREVGAVLLPFDAVTFASFKSGSFEPEYVWGRYVDWFVLGARKDQRLSFFGKWAKAVAAPYVGEWEVVLQYLTRSAHFREPNGPAGGLKLTFFENGTLAARRHLAGAEVWDPDMEWAFRRLVDDLVGRGIRVVLIRFPVTRAYALESRRLGADPALRDRLLASVGRPGAVDHLDHEALLFDAPELFTDGDHLNPAGKRRYSQRLAVDLARLGVLSGAPAGAGGL